MKSITNTLRTKYQNAVRNDRALLAKFIKRRRTELGKTLEEVCEGICSTSYLSKIENCLVEVDDSYFMLLFEKLDLNFNEFMAMRQLPVYPEVIKAFLLKNNDYLTEKVNFYCKSNNYCETEIEILVTLYNIVAKNYHEVAVALEKLDDIKNTLTKEELEFVGFLNALYNFKVKKLNGIEEELDVLLSIVDKEDVLYVALLDLGLDICFETGHVAKFYEKINLLQKCEFVLSHPSIINHHFLQQQLFFNLECHNDMTIKMNGMRDLFLNDLETYNYHYAIALTRNKKYREAYELLIGKNYTIESLALMGYCVDNLNDYTLQAEFLEIVNGTDYPKEGPYYDYLEFIRLKFEQYSYNQLYVYLKTALTKFHRHQNYWVFNALRINFNKLAFELGKYKEAVKFSMIN